MGDNKNFDEKKYGKADIMAARIPVIYCPNCHEVRAESEMIEAESKCIFCSKE